MKLSAKKRWAFRGATLLLVVAVCELISYASLRVLNTRYPMDPMAEITPERVESFLDHYYDPYCGWVCSRQRDDINSLGARSDRQYTDLEQTISVYGDSWTFGYGVAIPDSWPACLERMAHCGVLNFGVNGYGTDQALMRLEDNYQRAGSSTVVLAITTENINRCLCINKAFYQAKGMSPKPRFVLRNGELSLLNPFDTPGNVRDMLVEHPEKLVSLAENYDYWYREKTIFGKPWSISFPHTVQMCARIPFILRCARTGLTNISSHAALYHDDEGLPLMKGILRRFYVFGAERGFTPVVLILPTLRDVRRYQDTGEVVYQPMVDYLATNQMPHVDVLCEFAQHPDMPSVYLERRHHLSRRGCQLVAKKVYRKLQELGAVPPQGGP